MKNLHAPHTLHFLSSGAARSKLAHWPPPLHDEETKLVAHAPEPKQPGPDAPRSGLRLTRSAAGEFHD